jgi:hypothetical protein
MAIATRNLDRHLATVELALVKGIQSTVFGAMVCHANEGEARLHFNVGHANLVVLQPAPYILCLDRGQVSNEQHRFISHLNFKRYG